MLTTDLCWWYVSFLICNFRLFGIYEYSLCVCGRVCLCLISSWRHAFPLTTLPLASACASWCPSCRKPRWASPFSTCAPSAWTGQQMTLLSNVEVTVTTRDALIPLASSKKTVWALRPSHIIHYLAFYFLYTSLWLFLLFKHCLSACFFPENIDCQKFHCSKNPF